MSAQPSDFQNAVGLARPPAAAVAGNRPWLGGVAYAQALLCVGAAAAVAGFAPALRDLTHKGLVFLVVLVLVAARFDRGPTLLAAAASVVAFGFCFLPQGDSFAAPDLLALAAFTAVLCAGALVSARTSRLREERLRNVMLRSLGHDLRTPLAAITGAATALLDGPGRLDDAARTELLHAIRGGAGFLERQIRNLLDLTKLEAGTLRIEREWHPVDEVVGGAMTRAEPMLAGRSVHVHVPPDLPLVAIDALLVEQLLVNLLENAARHTPAGSPIEVSAQRVQDRLRLHVADRGPGIPSAQRERVFAKFHRGEHADRSGAGLGLAICRAIAGLHGGRIWVEDRAAGGALFVVELPIAGGAP